MKKVLSFLLVLTLTLSAMAILSACDLNDAKGKLEELNDEQWEAALSEPNFENVTIRYEFTYQNTLQKHTVKVTKDGLYRSVEALDAEGKQLGKQEAYFEGDNAKDQRNLFLQTFLGIVKDRSNFEYDKEAKAYTVDDAEIRIDQAGGIYVIEKVKNGKLVFSDKGNVESFVCNLTETPYMNGEMVQTMTIDVTWTFSDYGTTEITDTEKAAKNGNFGVTAN